MRWWPALLLVSCPAHADRPLALGRFADWTAAAHSEAGQVVCYAFTRSQAATPGGRGSAVLSVTERPTERDDVAIAEAFAFRRDAAMRVDIGDRRFDFYLVPRAAFAHDGAAVVTALSAGGLVIDHTLSPQGLPWSDQFSLRGFAEADSAINRACPES
jgi:hypothetical protein